MRKRDMEATVVDLRYKMKDVLKALDRNEKVTVLYHGKIKGIIIPAERESYKKITEHPFFGMSAQNNKKSVLEELNDLRKSRYNDI
ncbi:MAG TPA: type II toxin-antitoxin system Phd/YefM family antitoxin [Deltaproteobacteria bacterium]|nr:type II toxin-antitoxin system Phd/YefM family antitoxin [Deltaproteobacteria bacterium]